MKIVVINAAPMAGKDSVAKGLVRNYNLAVHAEMKEALVDAGVRIAGISRKLWDAFYEREYKEEPCPYLLVNGKPVSPRQWLIHVSEDVMKPMFGKNVFGNAAANRLKSLPCSDSRTFVFSDGGFIEELEPIIELCGKENFYLVRLHRDGYDFTGDSRSFLYPDKEKVPNQTDIKNIDGKLYETIIHVAEFANFDPELFVGV